MDKALRDKGLAMRKAVLGEDYVNKSLASADAFNGPFQEIQSSKLLARILILGSGIAECGASGFCSCLLLLMLTRRTRGDVHQLLGRQRRIDPMLCLPTGMLCRDSSQL